MDYVNCRMRFRRACPIVTKKKVQGKGLMREQKKQKAGQARALRARRVQQKRHYKQNKAGIWCVSCIVLILIIAMSTQIFRLHLQNEEMKAEEQRKTEQLEAEQERQEEIRAYEDYVTTPEYIEQLAKTRLGLVYSNEIVFKEEKP